MGPPRKQSCVVERPVRVRARLSPYLPCRFGYELRGNLPRPWDSMSGFNEGNPTPVYCRWSIQGGPKMKKHHPYPVVLLAAISLCGCPHFTHVAGPPCMGNGCPAGTKGEPPAAQHADYKQPAAADQPAPAPAPAQASTAVSAGQASGAAGDSTATASAQQKPGRFTRMLEALHLHSKS